VHYRNPHRRSIPQTVETSSRIEAQPPIHILSPILNSCYFLHVCTFARGSSMNYILSHEGNDPRTTCQIEISAFTTCADILFTLCFLASAIVALTICRAVFRGNLRPVAHALVSRHHKSRPLRTRQQDHSRTRQPTGISSTTALLIPTLAHDDRSRPVLVPFSAPAVSPSSLPCSSSYSRKTIQVTARLLASSSRSSPATNRGSSA